jgi:hypothetical protein
VHEEWGDGQQGSVGVAPQVLHAWLQKLMVVIAVVWEVVVAVSMDHV